jgi:hypothetical protein
MVGEKLACISLHEELLSFEVVSSFAVYLCRQCLAFPWSARLEKRVSFELQREVGKQYSAGSTNLHRKSKRLAISDNHSRTKAM